ncbi:MAG: peptidase S8 [Candidatus Eremiobacteraeota bacterium]|nr:peptidase S8 [Candidatus Eremiobacteraeota bacterium]
MLFVAGCNGLNLSNSLPASGVGEDGTRTRTTTIPSSYVRACPDEGAGFVRCDVLDATGTPPSTPSGLGATDLEAAYNLPSASLGAGQIVAAVDAFDAPNAASDLASYDAQYGLPAAHFRKYNQIGQQKNYPKPNPGWTLEESLDIEMLSAGCPKCTIILVEANNASNRNVEAAVQEAYKLGATVVSNSYGGGGLNEAVYTHHGVTVLASSGDGGYGTQQPASFERVVSVGGTILTKGGGGRGWSEVAWPGSGSGCTNQPKPSWQTDAGCHHRTMNDVSAVATNVAVYESGWTEVAGTSISSPLVSSIFGLAGNSTTQDGGKTFWEPKHHKALYDITTGSNGTCTPSYLCTAGPGYDGPTGWGTPNGIGAF